MAQWRAVTYVPAGKDALEVLPKWAKPLLPKPVSAVPDFWAPRSEAAAAITVFININESSFL
jgi:hypothetical protein